MGRGSGPRKGSLARSTSRRGPRDRSSGSSWSSRPGRWRTPSRSPTRRGSRPGRRIRQFESRLAFAHDLRLGVTVAERLLHLGGEQVAVVRTVAVDELADHDLARLGERALAGRGAVADLAQFLIELHGVEAVAHLVAALVQGRAGREDFDEAEAFLVEDFLHRPAELLHVIGGPARDVCGAGSLGELDEIERG